MGPIFTTYTLCVYLLCQSAAADDGDTLGWERVEGRTSEASNGKPLRNNTQPQTNPPTSTEPTNTEPTSTEPTSTEPTSTEPTNTEPTNTEPTSTEPTNTEQAITEPVPLRAEGEVHEGKDAEDDEGEDATSGSPTTAELLLQVDKDSFDIPIVFNAEVIQWVEWFTGPGRSTMLRWMERSGQYKNLIQGELIRARMPTDIFYLAMIESGFSPTAQSHADAVGVWQFIEPTANDYGLQVDAHIDQRRDTTAATLAALTYLSKLKEDFGNWHMAFAAYNAGEGLVFSAVRSYGTINYWGLARVGALPAETRDYVPKLLAAAIIAKNPALFGFENVQYLPPLRLEAIEVNAGTAVADLARCARMEEAEFRALNPHLIGTHLPDEPSKIAVYLPPEDQSDFLAALRGQLRGSRTSSGHRVPVTLEEPPDLSHHDRSLMYTTQPGDTVESIAEWYGIDSTSLRTWNNLDEDVVLEEGMELRTSAPRARQWTSYTTRPGESLASIAQRHRCSVDELRGWNGLEEDVRSVDSGTVLWLQAP